MKGNLWNGEYMTEKNGDVKKENPAKYKSTQHFVNDFWNSGNYAMKKEAAFPIYQTLQGGQETYVKKIRLELLKFYDNEKSRKNLCKKDMYEFLADIIDKEKDRLRTDVIKSCQYRGGSNEEELTRVAMMLFGADNIQKRFEFITAMKYWIQGILWKMAGKTFVWPIIPVFWSREHGTGKSDLMSKFYEPLQPFVTTADFKKLADSERYYKLHTENFVVAMNELANAKKQNIEVVKDLTTAAYSFARIFQTQDIIGEKNISSLIATSNVSSARILNDTTGNRRFFDIHISREITQAEIRSINALKIFQSQRIWGDVEINNMRTDYEKYLKPQQDSAKKQDCVEEFIEVANLKYDSASHHIISMTELFGNFVRWYNYQGVKTPLRRKEFKLLLLEHLKAETSRSIDIWDGLKINLEAYLPDCADKLRFAAVNRSKFSSILEIVK